MAKISGGEIVYRIRVVGLRYIVHVTHKVLGMLVIEFIVLMKHLIKNSRPSGIYH